MLALRVGLDMTMLRAAPWEIVVLPPCPSIFKSNSDAMALGCARLEWQFQLSCGVLFNSLGFALFLPAVFGLYWWLGDRRNGLRLQNVLLILSGYLFYGLWDWRFLILLFTATVVDYWVGLKIGQYRGQRAPRWVLAISVVMNIGMLGTFKYFDFFSQGLMDLLAELGMKASLPLLDIILPVGISFYTFQTLSYTIDCWRGRMQPTRDVIAFFAFVSFFPPLVAGPIERGHHLLPQMLALRRFDRAWAVTGLRLMLWGFFKKIAIADALGPYVEHVYGGKYPIGGWEVVVATLLFGIQIYCDFSGYTDIARGSARLLGFELAINFNRPYFSSSLQAFWTRWHISLSSWFRDYLYIPLGGNRSGPVRQSMSILAVFLVSGLWHGAAMTFVVWGAIHGVWFLVEKWLALDRRLPRPVGAAMTLTIVMSAWLFFRAKTWESATRVVAALADWNVGHGLWEGCNADFALKWSIGVVLGYFAVLIAFLLASEATFDMGQMGGRFASLPRWVRWGFYYLLIVWILALGAYSTPQQFIYFQF
jgi:alginate O-acetyltransferase complex protein AlgI